ncbi:MAG TPA: FAD:protein FMN transferase [Bacilli bacterium]|nr:FAD:protein FMN transferase [Bacilli bacterium]
MNKLKAFLRKFSRAEILIVTTGFLIAILLVSVAFGYEKKNTQVANVKFVQITERIKDVDYREGSVPIDPFHTPFYVAYDFTHENEAVARPQIENVLNEELIYHHKLFDRHRSYYVDHDALPENRLLMHNLKYVNDHIGEEVEIDYPLYFLLSEGLAYTLDTPNGAFNMFVGELYDFWQERIDFYERALRNLNVTEQSVLKLKDPSFHAESALELEELRSYIPATPNEINSTLKLRQENGKYYAKLNKFNGGNVSLSVGALGKGYMTDILKEKLRELNFVNGYIFGGASSLTFLSDSISAKIPIRLPSIKRTEERPYYRESSSYVFTRRDEFSISTSGTYEGYRFKDENGDFVVRSHILNPLTGYPAEERHEAISVVSNKLTGLKLDYLTTVLIVLSEEEGISFLSEHYEDKDVNVIYLGSERPTYYAHYTKSFPGGINSDFDQISEYREKILELL